MQDATGLSDRMYGYRRPYPGMKKGTRRGHGEKCVFGFGLTEHPRGEGISTGQLRKMTVHRIEAIPLAD